MAPKWISYLTQCPFCVTFHLSWVLWIVVGLPLYVAFTAPVLNMVLDLIVRALVRANEPPVVLPAVLSSTLDQGHLRWGTATTAFQAGQIVQVAHGDGVQIPDSMRYAHWPANERAPDGWEQINRDSSLYRTSGLLRWWPGKLVGRKVRVVTGPRAGQTGTIDNGEGPAVFRSGMDVTPWTYLVKPDVAVVKGPEDPHDGRIKVLARDCILLDAPFNPLDHEQTK